MASSSTGDLFVVDRVEDQHDLAIDIDSIGEVEGAAEHLRNGLGYRRFAVARVSVEKDGLRGIDCRAQRIRASESFSTKCLNPSRNVSWVTRAN